MRLPAVLVALSLAACATRDPAGEEAQAVCDDEGEGSSSACLTPVDLVTAAPSAPAEDAPKAVLLDTHDSAIKAVLMVCAIGAGLLGLILFVICCGDDPRGHGERPFSEDENLMDLLQKMHLPPCEHCGVKNSTNELCRDCQVVAYCTPTCREAHRERHSEVCGRLAAIRTKHMNNPPVPQDTPDVPDKMTSAEMGYFTDWTPDAPFNVLKDVATYFVKYRADIMQFSLGNLAKSGRALTLLDISTERFKPLHSVEEPLRMMSLPPGAINTDPRLAIFNCTTVAALIDTYDPTCSSVVAFTNGLNYMERPNAACPVFTLHHDEAQACRTIRTLDNSVLVHLQSP